MKLLYVCADPGIDVYGNKGAAVHVRSLCRALAARGAEVVLSCIRAEGPPPSGFGPYPSADASSRAVRVATPADAERVAGLLALMRNEPDMPDALHAATRALILQADLAALVERITDGWTPDVIYERYSLFADAGVLAARATGIPHLLELNAPLVHEQARYRALALEATARTVELRVLTGTNAVLAVSQPLARWARRTIDSSGAASPHVTVIPNAVDPAAYKPGDNHAAELADRNAVRRSLGLEHRSVITFAGSLKRWHGTAALIEAASALAVSHSSALVLIVGDGPERGALESRASDLGAPVRFAGTVTHQDVPRILAASDIGVAPYDGQHHGPAGFYFSPLKVFEYMAAGLPVVASDVGDIGLTVTSGLTGVLVAPGDLDALTTSLRRLLDDPANAQRMGQNGRRHVLGNHTWDKNAAQVLDLAESLRMRRAA